MKSYLKFLSRNKLYTAIEAVGLIVSLAFIVIISCYTWQQFAVTREVPDYERVYALTMGDDYLAAHPGEMSLVQERVPDVEAAARLKNYGTAVYYNGRQISGNPDVFEVDPVFFEFFPLEFLEGSAEVIQDKSQVLLGEAFARKVSPDRSPVGSNIVVRGDTCTVGGIIKDHPRSLLKESDIVRVLKEPDAPSNSSGFIIPMDMVLLRFREGTDLKATRALIDTVLVHEYESTYLKVNKPKRSFTVPIKELYFSEMSKNSGEIRHGNSTLVYVLIAVGILLLLSALFNYINLSVALTGKRAREMAIRMALGESRGRIAGRYVGEAIAFVTVCLILAVLLAKALEPVFNSYVAGDIGLNVAYSAPYLAAYVLLTLVVGAISGLVQAWMTFRYDPVAIIKGEQRRQTKMVFSKVFIIVQNAITVALISLALVMELQYHHLLKMPMGADVSNLYYISCGTVGRDELARRPYVDGIGICQGFPSYANMKMRTTKDDRMLELGIVQCEREAFDLFGLEVVKDFGVAGDGVWMTESLAQAYSLDEAEPKAPEFVSMVWGDMEVCGIIRDFATTNPGDMNGNSMGMVVVAPLKGQSTCVLKLNRFDADVRAELREIARQESIRLTGEEEYGEKVYGYIPELIEQAMQEKRRFISLIELFMLLATLISLLGLTAMSAYYAGIQTRDIAVRKVFGGTVGSETRRAVGEYLILVGIAILIGIPVSIYLAGKYLEQFWYRIEGYNWVFVVAAMIALAISFLSVLLQTLKAAKTNPAETLKNE